METGVPEDACNWAASVHRVRKPAGLERAAINAPMQGTTRRPDQAQHERRCRTCWTASKGTKMIMQVHDELVFEVPQGGVDGSRPRSRALMAGCGPAQGAALGRGRRGHGGTKRTEACAHVVAIAAACAGWGGGQMRNGPWRFSRRRWSHCLRRLVQPARERHQGPSALAVLNDQTVAVGGRALWNHVGWPPWPATIPPDALGIQGRVGQHRAGRFRRASWCLACAIRMRCMFSIQRRVRLNNTLTPQWPGLGAACIPGDPATRFGSNGQLAIATGGAMPWPCLMRRVISWAAVHKGSTVLPTGYGGRARRCGPPTPTVTR